MRSWIIIGGAVVAGLLLAMGIYLWGGAAKSGVADSVQVQDPGPQGRGGRGGVGGGGGMGPGGGGMFSQVRDSFGELVTLLGEASLGPSFNFSKEQKEKIQAIRDEVKAAQGKWRKDHAADFAKLNKEMQAVRDSGDRGGLRDVFQKRQELMATGPNMDEATKRLKGVLTLEQMKGLEAYMAAKRAEEEETRRAIGDFFGGGGPGGGGPGGGGRGAGGPGGGGPGGGGPGGGGPGGRGGAQQSVPATPAVRPGA